jgi:hypothetical protein
MMSRIEFLAALAAVRRGQLNLTPEDAREFWELLVELNSLGTLDDFFKKVME